MKYVLLFIRDEADTVDEGRYAAIDAWFGELGKQGKVLSGEELQTPATATTIRWSDGRPMVTDGPFMEAKETVAGFVTIDAADLDEAIAIAKRWPVQDQAVEIRPVLSHDDMPNHPVG